MKLNTVSMHRYNGGVKAKRLYGSSTLTTFQVFLADRPDMWVEVHEVGGATPGERATKAKGLAVPLLRAKYGDKLPQEG